MRKDFSDNPNLATRQRLAVAHIDAEQAIERRYAGQDGAKRLYTVDAVLDIHHLPLRPPISAWDGYTLLSTATAE